MSSRALVVDVERVCLNGIVYNWTYGNYRAYTCAWYKNLRSQRKPPFDVLERRQWQHCLWEKIQINTTGFAGNSSKRWEPATVLCFHSGTKTKHYENKNATISHRSVLRTYNTYHAPSSRWYYGKLLFSILQGQYSFMRCRSAKVYLYRNWQ